MGENHGVAFLLEFVDFIDERKHLFALFHGIGAKHGARLNGLETIVKFFCGHGNKYRKC